MNLKGINRKSGLGGDLRVGPTRNGNAVPIFVGDGKRKELGRGG